MVTAKTLIMDGTAKSLDTWLDGENRHCASILMQAPSTNSNPIYFGDFGSQDLYISADKSAALPANVTSDIYVKGTASDVLHVMLFG